jgi:uncharacterized membrane protein YebE (DUF533 family)
MSENTFLDAVKIWAAMAWADGVISSEETVAMKAIIRVGKLTEEERATALGWLENKVDLESEDLAKLSQDSKRRIYLSAARVAAIDKDVADAERQFLERLRNALGIDEAAAREIHRTVPNMPDDV